MKKEIFENAIATAEKLNNSTISAVKGEDRTILLQYMEICDKITELEKLKKDLQPTVISLFETEGTAFDHSAEKSACIALSYRKDNKKQYAILRQGENQEVVDTASYIASMGESNESLKAKGFVKTRKGTTSINKPNKAQLESLMHLFTEE